MGEVLVKWQQTLEQHWSALRFGEMTLLTENDQHLFEVQVYLDDLEPDAVRVELFANGIEGNGSERIEMKPVRNLLGAVNGFDCQAQVQAMRPASDYTARLIPQHDGVAVPLEDAHILWQR